MPALGAVIIGRNEGERLKRSLTSLAGRVARAVYVDSGSTDGSPAAARAAGVDVFELDPSLPFTAARARNAGFERLLALEPSIEFVQFIDGDCELAGGWIELAEQTLASRADVGVVCGRRRERMPDSSVYNRLCDIEWNTPVGEALACGGDAMMRVSALRAVNGFNAALIAGEEPELCLRLRQSGWTILRLDAEMTLHDAAMTRFGQWWRRAGRAGHAFAEGAALHGHEPGHYCVRQTLSGWVWGLLLPLIVLGTAVPTRGKSLLLLSLYVLLALRIIWRSRGAGMPRNDAVVYGAFCTLSKFPQMLGQLRFVALGFLGRRSTLIEYKRGNEVAHNPPQIFIGPHPPT
jgi:GT2 family glycosyltransferase